MWNLFVIILLLGRIARKALEIRPIATDRVAWSVGLSICVSDMTVNLAKTDEQIKMPFWLQTSVGPGNYVLDEGAY